MIEKHSMHIVSIIFKDLKLLVCVGIFSQTGRLFVYTHVYS